MKSIKGEVVLNITAQKAWEMYRDDEIISKINPEMLALSNDIQRDGGPGSLRLFKLGPELHSYVKESIEKIEKAVENGKSVTYSVIGGELKNLYDPIQGYLLSFIPVQGKETEQCIAEWKAEFEPLTPATPPPEKARDAALGFHKSFDKFKFGY